MASSAIRDDRAFVAVTGVGTQEFLQGLLSQDVAKVSTGRAAYGALLTPQGKFLHDVFITGDAAGLTLECEADRSDDLLTRLKRYRLRAKVEIAPVDGWAAGMVWPAGALELGDDRGAGRFEGDAFAYVDPRLAALGARVVGPRPAVEAVTKRFDAVGVDTYRQMRLGLGVPEGAADIAVDKGFLLENGFDELNGVDWKKGCYVGQELTARTKYRGLVKRRLMPVRIEGAAPDAGAALEYDGKNAGEMRGAAGEVGLALVRLDAWRAAAEAGAPLSAGEAKLWPAKPEWARFQ